MHSLAALFKGSLVVLCFVYSGLTLTGCSRTKTPTSTVIAQAVAATLTALPTATAVSTIARQEMAKQTPFPEPAPTQPIASTATPVSVAPVRADVLNTTYADETAAQEIVIEQTVIDLINARRQQHGLAVLVGVNELTLAARRHSRDMAHHNRTQHTGSDGSNGGQRMRDAGYQWATWDESIAWGMPEAADVVDWFFADETHRNVLLAATVTDIGVGYVSDASSQWQRYWTVNVGQRLMSVPAADLASAPIPTLPTAEPTQAAVVAQPEERAPTAASCPTFSDRQYATIPMTGVDHSHVDTLHGDLNLALRGFVPTTGALSLIEIAGPTDADAPQLAGLFADGQTRAFSALYQAYDWNWACGGDGCRGAVLAQPAVALLGLVTTAGEAIGTPGRAAVIDGGGYVAAVLYADESRITLAYTRDGTVAQGYAVHLDGLCVDPNLLAAYRTANGAGRGALPALHSNQALGVAMGSEVRVAVRDRGSFLDPRSRKDWWQSPSERLLAVSPF